MKPIHFKPKTQSSSNEPSAHLASDLNNGPGVAAVVRSATNVQRPSDHPHQRKVRLDDYVARIRQSSNVNRQPSSPEVVFRTNIQDEHASKPDVSIVESNGSVEQPVPTENHEWSESVDTAPDTRFYRTDTGHTPEGSPINPETIQQLNDVVHKLRAPHAPIEQFSDEGYQTEQRRRLDAARQRQIIDDISVAIASTLTDLPDQQLKEKLPTPEIDTTNPQVSMPEDSHELPVHVAAWDVEDFRWPTLSNQMIATAPGAMHQLYDHVVNVSNHDNTCPGNRLAVTGASRGEGTSTIAISLARWAAATGKSVLLIDADLANPKLTTQIGLSHGLSWLKAILRSDDPAEVIIRSQRTNLCVMPMAPLGARSDYPRCLFDSLGPFLGKVESYFDWVVMDFGPGSQLLAELSRPELLIDSALLVGANSDASQLGSLQSRLQSLGLERFVLAQNSVRQQEAA
jgi:Mrp family chromosome partitioning ATPase